MRKSILLASTAAFMAISGAAFAADVIVDTEDAIPVPPVATNNSVNLCDVAGTGFISIPGTPTCLKIGGAVEAGVGYVKVDGADANWARIEARMDVDTHTESDLGVIGSKVRVSLNRGFFDAISDADGREVGLELAYINVGPAFLGYKETLFNTKIGYGDAFDLEETIGSANSLTAGVLVDNIGGGFYAGGAIESSNRGQWIASYDTKDDVDFVGRFGLAGQSWGSTDVSAWHSNALNSWGLKSTTDVNVYDNTQARLTAAYFDLDGEDTFLVAAGAQHAFTDQVRGYAGIGYVSNDALSDPYTGSLGVVYTPVEGLDVSGEVAYTKAGDTDGYAGVLKFVRSW